MPISHKSIIHKPLDYTAPVDLNLLGKVLQFKQAQYDSGVAKTQASIDNLASLDVVRDEDRQYLNAKINNVVSTANNMGGADFADPNITNQIAGLSSQVYSDKNVIDSVGKTKKFRYVQNYYTDMKEKKPKDWNPANEWYDMQKFQSWLNGSGVNPNIEPGAGGVTPYTKYEEDWQKTFDKIVQSANITTEVTDKGLMYFTSTQKAVSPERIWQTAQKLLTPQQQQQLAIEGRFKYDTVPMSELIKASDMDTYNKIGKATQELKELGSKKAVATSFDDNAAYTKLIQEKQAEIDQLAAPARKNANQIKENLYLKEKLEGLASRYAFNQTSVKITPNSGAMFKSKMELEGQKFQYEQRRDARNDQIEMADKGLMFYTDPITGQTTVIRDPSVPRTLKGESAASKNGIGVGDDTLPVTYNSPEEGKTDIGESYMIERKTSLIDNNNKLFQDYVREMGALKGWDAALIDDAIDGIAGSVEENGAYNTLKEGVMEMYSAWQTMTKGDITRFQKLPSQFKKFADGYQKNLKEVEALDQYTSEVNRGVMKEFGVTQAEIDQYNNAKDNAYKIMDNAKTPPRFRGIVEEEELNRLVPPELKTKVEAYLGGKQDKVDAIINDSKNRLNFYGLTIQDNKEKDVAKMVSTNAGTVQYYDANGQAVEKASLTVADITPKTIGYDYLEGAGGKMELQPVMTFDYKDAKDKMHEYKVPLTPEQAGMFNLDAEAQTGIGGYQTGLTLNGRVNGVVTTQGRDYQLKYDIRKANTVERNDPRVYITVYFNDTPLNIATPFPTYQRAISAMEQASSSFKNIDEALEYFRKLENP